MFKWASCICYTEGKNRLNNTTCAMSNIRHTVNYAAKCTVRTVFILQFKNFYLDIFRGELACTVE